MNTRTKLHYTLCIFAQQKTEYGIYNDSIMYKYNVSNFLIRHVIDDVMPSLYVDFVTLNAMRIFGNLQCEAQHIKHDYMSVFH